MQKTELGFYLITDQEYYNLVAPEKDVIYVLVNNVDEQYLVLKNGQFLGKIDRSFKSMSMTANALGGGMEIEEPTVAFPGLQINTAGSFAEQLNATATIPTFQSVGVSTMSFDNKDQNEEVKKATTVKRRKKR